MAAFRIIGSEGATFREDLGTCDICGRPAVAHRTEIRNGVKSSNFLCQEHSGVDQSKPADVEALRKKLAVVDSEITDPDLRAAVRAELERIIADIEANQT